MNRFKFNDNKQVTKYYKSNENNYYQFNQMNFDAGAGWLVATLYFTTTTMYKFVNKK